LEDISCIQLSPIEPIGMLNIRKKYPQLLAIFIKPPSIKNKIDLVHSQKCTFVNKVKKL
jgi:guanylate kinase